MVVKSLSFPHCDNRKVWGGEKEGGEKEGVGVHWRKGQTFKEVHRLTVEDKKGRIGTCLPSLGYILQTLCDLVSGKTWVG